MPHQFSLSRTSSTYPAPESRMEVLASNALDNVNGVNGKFFGQYLQRHKSVNLSLTRIIPVGRFVD